MERIAIERYGTVNYIASVGPNVTGYDTAVKGAGDGKDGGNTSFYAGVAVLFVILLIINVFTGRRISRRNKQGMNLSPTKSYARRRDSVRGGASRFDGGRKR